jgi:hypothetical protein
MRLVELLQTSSSGNPPVLTDPGDDGGPKGGKYWVRGTDKVSIVDDFAVMVYRSPQEFGLSREALMDRVKQLTNAKTAEYIERSVREFWQREDTNSHKSEFDRNNVATFSGGRVVGANVLLSAGWGFVDYDTDNLSLWVSDSAVKPVIEAIGKQFPLMQIATFTVLLMKGLWTATPDGQTTIRFRREDFPGIAGMFQAIMHWARTGEYPEQHWLYTIPLGDPADGITADGPKNLYIGNWTERNVYLINYMPDGLWFRAWRDKGTVVRFPASAIPPGIERSRNDSTHTHALWSKQPFAISAEHLQTMVGGFWRPLLQA